MIFNILDNTNELWITKYIIGEIFSSGGATLYKNPSYQTVFGHIACLAWLKHLLWAMGKIETEFIALFAISIQYCCLWNFVTYIALF